MTDPVELLIIEDNPNDLELALHVFKQYKLANHIKVVRDGAEALEFLFGDDGLIPACKILPKVILLDLKLPKVDGLEVLRKIKSDPLTKLIPVVVMTSSRENRDLVASYELGVNSYIVKPVDFAQFTEVVRQLGMYWLLFNERPCLPLEQPTA
jgi:two-component system, response regulator